MKVTYHILLILISCVVLSQDNESGLLRIEHSILPSVPDQPVCKFYGYWDHEAGPENGGVFAHVNIGKGLEARVSKIVQQGIPAVPFIGGFSHTDSRDENRKRLKNKAQQIHTYNPEDIAFILLLDEPYGDWSDQQLEQLISDARELIGDEYKYGLTVKTLTINNRPERKLPQNADYIGINYYPFRAEGGLETRQEFQAGFAELIKNAREKVDGPFFIVGQGFHGSKWVMPPVESPLWYAEAVRDNEDIHGLFWFEWRDRSRWVGTESMPAHFEMQKKAAEVICSGE